MVSEQKTSKELMIRNWSFTYFEELDRINAGLKELGIPPDQVSQLIEATNELKDTDFRTAAFSLLELKKRIGKSYKEAEAYIQSLKAQITSKEKLTSSWTGKIEKAKGELRGWEQKRNDERAGFESEQARHKRTLKEDEEKLNRELSKNNEVRENIEETISLKAELKKISMDLPMFKSIVRETVLEGGLSRHIAKNIKEAIKTFGSLGKTITERKREEKARTKAILSLSQEEKCLKEAVQGLGKRSTILSQEIRNHTREIHSKVKLLLEWDERIEKKKWQWECFQMFISMLLASPSAPDSLAPIALKLQELEQKGWTHYGGLTLPEQRRAVFIFVVVGIYLHSIHCSNCGASFIVNKAHNAYTQWRSSYYCPVCDLSSYTKPDDTFLNLMVSPELNKKLQDARTLLDTMGKADFEALGKKLKLLDSIPNEVYKAFSEGRKVQVKVLNGTDWRKEP